MFVPAVGSVLVVGRSLVVIETVSVAPGWVVSFMRVGEFIITLRVILLSDFSVSLQGFVFQVRPKDFPGRSRSFPVLSKFRIVVHPIRLF